jgi:hypothetical protein
MMRLFGSVLTALALMAAGGCGGPSHEVAQMETSGRLYPSIEALTEAADLAVVGHVSRVVAKEIDGGGGPETRENAAEGIPMVFYEFIVTKTVKGNVPGGKLILGAVDLTRISVLEESELRTGQEVLLYLLRRTPATSPGISSVGTHYVTLAGDNAVFDLVEGVATARSDAVRGLTGDAMRGSATSPLSVPLSDIQRVAAAQ